MAVVSAVNNRVAEAVAQLGQPEIVASVVKTTRLVADFEHHGISARLILDELTAQPVPVSPERFAELTFAAEKFQVKWVQLRRRAGSRPLQKTPGFTAWSTSPFCGV